MTNAAELHDQLVVFMQEEHRGGFLLAGAYAYGKLKGDDNARQTLHESLTRLQQEGPLNAPPRWHELTHTNQDVRPS